jgi:hypothetical protein
VTEKTGLNRKRIVTPTWGEMIERLERCIRKAKKASAEVARVRDWNQVMVCMLCLTEVEDAIRLANPTQKWTTDPEPIAKRFQAELMKLDELSARTQAQQMQRWLRAFPIP